MKSCMAPCIVLGAGIICSYSISGMYGVAMAAMGMLSFVSATVSVDTYGPISDNAGGIAESEFDEDGTEIPGYVTSVPLAASLSASEKASRKLTKCKFKARLAGAIHFAELKGSLTYEL